MQPGTRGHEGRFPRTSEDESVYSGEATFTREHSTRSVKWEVRDFRVRIKPPEDFNDLTEDERAALFKPILEKVRKRSEHPDQFLSAALAITNSGKIYVASNTQRQHEYHKDCAEMNLVNIINQLEGSEAKISSLYLLAGIDTQKPAKPYAPCGKCMDTLCSCSLPDASITMFPVDDGKQPILINRSATHASDVPAGQTWKTPLRRLQIDSVRSLSDTARKYGEEGWQALTNGPTPVQPLEEGEIHRIRGSKLSKLSAGDLRIRQCMEKAMLNAAQGRKSETELDVDHSPSSINHFMVDKIAKAYHQRPKSLIEGQREVETVRCVVMRLVDGSFHSITEVEGPHENAVPHAEITAVAATRDLNQGITDVWVMSMNRKDIAQGILRTSPKESLERVHKRRHKNGGATDNDGAPIKDTVNMHYIPFNNGTLTNEEVSDITYHYQSPQLFPSQFNGAKHDLINGRGGGDSCGMCK